MKPIAARLALAWALAATLTAPHAQAQNPARRRAREGQAVRPGLPPPPPALPGARTDKEMVAPPDRAPSDLLPNEALFDRSTAATSRRRATR